MLPLDDGDLPSGLGKAKRERLPGLAGADDDGVVSFWGLHGVKTPDGKDFWKSKSLRSKSFENH
jgi:hypothetical protein